MKISISFIFLGVALLFSTLFSHTYGSSAAFQPMTIHPPGPECWTSMEKISFTGERKIDQTQTAQRLSIYEIHEDDSVNPNHFLTGIPYYESYTWYGSDDVEWLVLEGNFSRYEINSINHTVTFYDVQDWLHVVYRTNNFIQRSTDQIRFCVIGGNVEGGYSIKVQVLYPAYYTLDTATPDGYIQPAAGEIFWDFGEIIGFMVDTYFSGLGPDRPLFDLPVDYQGRSNGSSVAFARAFNSRTISLFDHRYPNGTQDQKLLSYTGTELNNVSNGECTSGFNCSDGHTGYDFDDTYHWQSPCDDPQAVYPAAEGDILPGESGWDDTLGCTITIDHGNNWKTRYARLLDTHNDHSCNGILIASGHVTNTQQIGIMGNTGSLESESNIFLHFEVMHNDIVVDPSGWEPIPLLFADPWANHVNGTDSYPMWKNAIRTTRAFASNYGGNLTSPTHVIQAHFPANFYDSSAIFNLSDIPAPVISSTLMQTGNSFSLSAMDLSGNFIHQLSQPATLTMTFNITDTKYIAPDISFYTWNPDSSSWEILLTTVDWNKRIATTQIDHLSIFALAGKPKVNICLPLIIK